MVSLVLKTIISICLVFWSLFAYSQQYFEKASEEYFKGNLKASIELFTIAIENKEEIAKSYMLRGSAKGESGDFYGAVSDLNFSKKIDSTDYRLYFLFGRTYFFNGFDNVALNFLNTSVSLNEKDADVLNFRASVKIKLGDYLGAISDEDNAIKINPKNNSYFTNRGYAKSMLNLINEAVEDYNKSLLINNSAKGFSNRGYAYFVMKEYLKAIKDYSEALNISEKDSEIYYRRGLSYEAMGNHKLACVDFNESAELGYSLAIKKVDSYCKN
ncbi:MAG: hypothetical protein COB15_08655 [Flavobacteriales bacterium]|nr:MAG: hypothetical protein COB15_08655 [Flavobacteriales bacterium]